MADLYVSSFSLLCAANVYIASVRWRSDKKSVPDVDSREPSFEKPSNAITDSDKVAVRRFQTAFFGVYSFVVASDWLQGPYIYALYKDEKGLPERIVAILFAAGFVAAAISASFAGAYADRFGRKKAALFFCVAYSLSCATVVSDSVVVLFCGRLLGGVCTTLLYSIFETWMVHEFHAQGMADKGLDLGNLCGLMITCSSVVAIISGVTGEVLVRATQTKTAPFLAAVGCLIVAFGMIRSLWAENYGSTETKEQSGSTKEILSNKRIMALAAICCLFEGTMYLFVFFWSAALKSSRAWAGFETPPPFGLVFATFMASMMLGSQLFSFSGTQNMANSVTHLGMYMVLSGLSLLTVVFFKAELPTLWCLCAFEACIGLYFPSMGYLRSQIVPDNVRGKVYSWLRLPLNTFVVLTLSLHSEGDRHRENIILMCCGLLLVGFLVSRRYLAQEQ